MLRLTDIKTTVFEYKGYYLYRMDNDDGMIEYYIQDPEYGIIEGMYGISKEGDSLPSDEELDDFIEGYKETMERLENEWSASKEELHRLIERDTDTQEELLAWAKENGYFWEGLENE